MPMHRATPNDALFAFAACRGASPVRLRPRACGNAHPVRALSHARDMAPHELYGKSAT